MSKIEVDKIDPQSGTALEVGTSGDTVTVPSGVGLTLTDSTLLLPTTIKTDKLDPKSGTALEIGTSGDTVTVPTGVGLTLTDSTLLLPTTIKTDKLDPKSGTALEIGTSGDTVTVPSGVGLTLTDSTLLLPTTITSTTEVKTNKISPATGTAFAMGDSGDTFTVPSGATISNLGTATGFGSDPQWTLLSTGTPSDNSATFEFVDGTNGAVIDTTYKAYRVTGQGLFGYTDDWAVAWRCLVASSEDTSVYKNALMGLGFYGRTDTGQGFNYANTGMQGFFGNTASNADAGHVNFEMLIDNTTGARKSYRCITQGELTDGNSPHWTEWVWTSGCWQSTSAYNGFSFHSNTAFTDTGITDGNWSNVGVFKLYGLTN